ncbi:MAG: hypothetical protein DMG11_31435 [Acidobacteria bacterium]|nr:MAG: hypothetical protein DMG11_31435 [Acidobacteriota bacterium]
MDFANVPADRNVKLTVCFTGASEEDPIRGTSGSQRLHKLTCRCDFETAATQYEMTQNRESRIRFDRVKDFEVRQCSRQCIESSVECVTIVQK